jgi:protein gp37
MGKETKISWCDATWNCWQGCTKVAPECANCYAEREMLRWGKEPHKIVRSKDATFYAPLKWKEPRRIFVCSWSDFFHEDVDPSWRDEAWNIIASKPTHTFIILTKRPQNIPAMLPRWDWPSAFQHVWFLVSAGTNESLAKFWPVLRDIPGLAVRGISMEPLLEYVGMAELTKLCLETVFPQWIIVGGESGPQRRRMDPVWSRLARDWCEAHSVPFFFKGHVGNVHTPENETLDGKVYHEYPR